MSDGTEFASMVAVDGTDAAYVLIIRPKNDGYEIEDMCRGLSQEQVVFALRYRADRLELLAREEEQNS